MRIVIATRNEGKLIEYRRMLEALGVEVVSMREAGLPPDADPPEDRETFDENALSKARYLQERLGGWALGDDSGLEVDALGGMPGVRSARFAGHSGGARERDEANTEKLLSALQNVPDGARTARFVCVIALVGPRGREVLARGTCEGSILRAPRGTGGFGYDPVFLPSGLDLTMAELELDQKNRISHRGRALDLLGRQIQELRE